LDELKLDSPVLNSHVLVESSTNLRVEVRDP